MKYTKTVSLFLLILCPLCACALYIVNPVPKDSEFAQRLGFSFSNHFGGNGMVGVTLNVPNNGELEQLGGITLYMRDAEKLLLSAPLLIRNRKDEPRTVFFYIRSALLDESYIWLNMIEEPPQMGYGYEIRLREYVVDTNKASAPNKAN